MRFKFILVFLLFVNSVLYSQQNIPADAHIVLQKGRLSLYGKKVDKEWTITGIQKIMGNHARISMDAPFVDTYDELGIMFWRYNPSYYPNKKDTLQNMQEFMVSFHEDSAENYSYMSSSLYTGSVYVDGMILNYNTSLDNLTDGLPNYHFKMSEIKAYEGIYRQHYIYAKFNADNSHLLWIAIGKED